MTVSQQEFLRNAAKAMGLTQPELAQRMRVPLTTFKKWLLPSSSMNFREMPEMAWNLVRVLQENQRLTAEVERLKTAASKKG